MSDRIGRLVVVCGTTYWSGTRLLDQHLASELTRYTHVLYVDPPTSVLTRFRNSDAAAAQPPGLVQVDHGLHLLSTRVPPLKERPGIKSISLELVRRSMREAVRRLGNPSVQAMVVPSLNPYFGTLDERFSVFYAKDDYLAGAGLMGISGDRLRQRVRQQPRDADVVVAVSSVLADSFRSQGIHALLIPNGCDPAHFASAGVPAAGSEPIVAYVGHLSDRVDVDLLAAVACSGVRLRLVGPVQETMTSGHFDRLLASENVTWLGAKRYAELPGLLSDVTTCVLPYADTPFNRASFPLKVLEYLAAGRRVVATGLPAVRWLDTDLVSVATGPDQFRAKVIDSVAHPLETGEWARRREFAALHSWRRRAEILAEAIGLTADRRAVAS